jgi:hypothetical protein
VVKDRPHTHTLTHSLYAFLLSDRRPMIKEALAKPLGGVCKREGRIQKTGVRIIGHVAHERVTILNSEYWLLNTALAEPTKEVLQAPQRAIGVGAAHEVGPSLAGIGVKLKCICLFLNSLLLNGL